MYGASSLSSVVQLETVDKVLGALRPAACVLNSCPSWLVKASVEVLWNGFKRSFHSFLIVGRVPMCLRPILKKKKNLYTHWWWPPRDTRLIFLFLSKVLKWVIAKLLQHFLDETNFLDPFQSCLQACLRDGDFHRPFG